MNELLEIIRDESKDDETRWQAAYCYGLLLFAERVDDNTVRITNDTQEKLQTYLELLKLKREIPE